MKKLKQSILIFAATLIFSPSQGINQIIDISTGVVNNSTALIPYGNIDDTWQVRFPAASNFQNAYAAYNYQWPTVTCGRWISPEPLNITGGPGCSTCSSVTGPGIYTYRMNFTPNSNCNILSAKIVFSYTNADNELPAMHLNGNYTYTYPAPQHQLIPGIFTGFNPATPYTLILNPQDIVSGNNTLDFDVQNYNYNSAASSWTVTGLALCAYIEITYEDNFVGASITGPSKFCANTPITLTGFDGANATASSYQWQILESNAAGTPTNVFNTWTSPVYSGSPGAFTFPAGIPAACNKYYLVKLILNNSCYNKTVSKVIFITCPPFVDLGPDLFICDNSCVTLTAVTGPVKGISVSWFLFDDEPHFIGSGHSITVCPAKTTTYCVTVKNTITGCSASDCITITVENISPNFNIATNTANNNYMEITGTPVQTTNFPAGFGYVWKVEELSANNNNTVWLVNNPSCWSLITNFQGLQGLSQTFSCTSVPGQFKYNTTYRITRGVWSAHCPWKQMAYLIMNVKSMDGSMIIVPDENAPDISYLMSEAGEDILAIAETGDELTVYPNPGSGIFTLQFGSDTRSNVEVYDALGKKVKSFEQRGEKATLDLSDYPKGIYIVNVISNGRKTSKKIVLE